MDSMSTQTIVSSHIVKFSEIENTKIFITNEKANYNDSIKLLHRNELFQIGYKNILKEIIRTPKLIDNLLGKGFYLKDRNNLKGGFYTFDNEGNLNIGKGDLERTVFVWNKIIEDVPLIFRTENDNKAVTNRARYTIHAVYDESTVVPLIVGIKVDSTINSIKRD